MRCRFLFDRDIVPEFAAYMTSNLERMGSVIGFVFGERFLDVTFRGEENDVDSVIELAESRGYFILEDDKRPRISRINLVSALFLFVVSVVCGDNLVQTFCCLLIFLFCGNQITVYAWECLSRRLPSVAFITSLLTFTAIAGGLGSFLYPRYDFGVAVYGSLIMNLAMVYYYVTEKKGG